MTAGVVQGWWDYYIIAPLQRRLAPNVITKVRKAKGVHARACA